MTEIGRDYGNAQFNIDKAKKIRYGAIETRLLPIWHKRATPFTEKKNDEETEIGFYFEDAHYIAEQALGDTMVLLAQSPYYTRAMYCDQFTPGAGDLSKPHPRGVKTYAFGYDWFGDDEYPYPLFCIETDQQIER